MEEDDLSAQIGLPVQSFPGLNSDLLQCVQIMAMIFAVSKVSLYSAAPAVRSVVEQFSQGRGESTVGFGAWCGRNNVMPSTAGHPNVGLWSLPGV